MSRVLPGAVAGPEVAIASVGLAPEQRVADLDTDGEARFRRLVGWEPGGPVVDYPTADERAARARREDWKALRLGRVEERTGPVLLLREPELERARRAVASGTAPDWFVGLLDTAHAVAALPRERLLALVPTRVPWNTAGSFCPACVGHLSDSAIHAAFWRWRVAAPEQLQCPHCGIVYPHADYPEEGRLELPRLGLSYEFYLADAERARDWRDGEAASRFGGGPTHVALAGETERCGLNWLLGQLEPLAVAAAVTDEEAVAETVTAVLCRLADVYPGYPLYSYRQEYYDCEPAYAVDHVDAVPTPFRRAACLYTYSGQLGAQRDLHGRGDNTVGLCHYPNAEWGVSRLAREKASHGQLFLSLLHAYDLVAHRLTSPERHHIETNLLLEYYLDVRGLTKRVDNKSGPGTAARVAVGLFWHDDDELEDGVTGYRRLLAGQFHGDGSWKETPIYGAKALIEGLWEVPELLRDRDRGPGRDLYDEPLLRRAFETWAEVATPCGTQPTLDDSPVDFSLPAQLRDLARLRLGVRVPAGPERLAAFGPVRSGRRGFGGYVPRIDMVADGEDERLPVDGGLGFAAVGHLTRTAPDHSWVDLFCGGSAPAPTTPRAACNRFYRGRGLACLGFGAGDDAVQLYVDGGDGRRGHRHRAPLSLLWFVDGREVFPDSGYLADHPANAWIRSTPAHNTVSVDGSSVEAAGRCQLCAFVGRGAWRYVDLRVPVRVCDGESAGGWFRRRLLLLPGADDRPHLLADVFDARVGDTHDYIVRAGAPGSDLSLAGGSPEPRTASPFAETWPTPPRDVGSAGSVPGGHAWSWGGEDGVVATSLTGADELVTFQSPAWRTHADVFDDPQRAWSAALLRQQASTEHFVVCYAVGCGARQVRWWREDVTGDEDTGDGVVSDGTRPLRLQVEGGGHRHAIEIGAAGVQVRDLGSVDDL